MVSAFRAMGETVQTRQGSGLIMDWKQSAGNLLVGGDSRVIKVWDAQTEVQGYVRTVFFPFLRMLLISSKGFVHGFREPCHLYHVGSKLLSDFHC